jgi:hypothetical protein
MDNSEAERRLREMALGRKNYYGSGSVWSAALAAMLFTLFQTLLLHLTHNGFTEHLRPPVPPMLHMSL